MVKTKQIAKSTIATTETTEIAMDCDAQWEHMTFHAAKME